ncbi:hypothetical protein BCV69DRAFT_313386 [Microstroma glucosiphilum]|uniref:Uncharacterized protein n=1 Tax=Pseudomicrostroma glucosiphilum TaxID=1684307 RepID=A0A316U2R6_9BASI|nr:hypothetical protein BCV69DRAFT_313386 [Pseudomicrostroma glucosiphilum]PWN19629.1 hypothetical protein BCV69DRAFT_313386 [Pseudomicrostroma glucosiphilum]
MLSLHFLRASGLVLLLLIAALGQASAFERPDTANLARELAARDETSAFFPNHVVRAATSAAATTTSPVSTFCDAFIKQCYKSALSGQTGDVNVVYTCQRDGAKTYTYSCKGGTTDVTEAVLNALGEDYIAYTTVSGTTIATRTSTSIVKTAYASTRVIKSTVATESEATTTVKSIASVKKVAATKYLTTQIPITVSSLSFKIVTKTSTATGPATTTVGDGVFLGDDEVPVSKITLSSAGKIQRRALTEFCSAYSLSCTSKCASNSTTVKTSVCRADTLPKYKLACICTNGNTLTQQALAAVVEDQHLVTVSQLTTSTAFIAAPRTKTLSETLTTTRLITYTTQVPITVTSTFISTRTTGTITFRTGVSTKVTTKLIKSRSTTIKTAAPSNVVTTTTRTVLAATGYVRGFNNSNGAYVGSLGNSGYFAQLAAPNDSSTAVEFMAIRDPTTGAYQLAELGNPENVIINEAGNSVYKIEQEAGTYAFGYTSFGPASSCGTAASSAGPADGASPLSTAGACETYVIAPLAETPVPASIDLKPYWFNPNGSATAAHIGVWGTYGTEKTLIHVADKAAFLNHYGPFPFTWVTLKFPYAS